MYDSLFKLISTRVVLNDKEIILCKQYFEPVLFPKNHIIEEEGKIPRYLYFVVSGFLRLFHYNDFGEEVTTHIECPKGFISDYSNFVTQTKSSENVECITDCELLKISKKNLDILTNENSVFKDFSIHVFQQSIVYYENRSREFATNNAEQRYLKLIEKYPAIILNVPLQYIASFLGINPKSLSRIRKQIIR